MCAPTDEEPLGRLIYYMAQDLGKFAEKVLKPFDLTLEQLHILRSMPENRGVTQKHIGQAVNKTPANMTRILDRLEEKNLIKRRQNPKDRRATLVLVTPKGKKTTEKVAAIFESYSTGLLQGVSLQEQDVIRVAFQKMTDNLQKISAKACQK